MAESIRNRVLSALQHGFCHIHYVSFTSEYMRELMKLVRFLEVTNKADLVEDMIACFPEAPKVTTETSWNRFIAVVHMDPQVPRDKSGAWCEMAEKGAAMFRTCKSCRIWADRQVPLSTDEKQEMVEAMRERDELNLRLDYANDEIAKANRKRKVSQKNVEALLSEIWRLH